MGCPNMDEKEQKNVTKSMANYCGMSHKIPEKDVRQNM